MLSRRQFIRGAGIAIAAVELGVRSKLTASPHAGLRSDGTSELVFFSADYTEQRRWSVTRTLRRGTGAEASLITLAYDPRLHSSSSSLVVVTSTGRSTRIEPTSVEESARGVVARFALGPSGSEEALLVLPLTDRTAFPHDGLDDAVLPTISVDATGQAIPLAVESRRAGVAPWAAPLSAAWGPVAGEAHGAPVPTLLRVESAGPAPTPAGLEIVIVTDERSAGRPTLASASGANGVAVKDIALTSEAADGLRRTTIRIAPELAATEERFLGLDWAAPRGGTAPETAAAARILLRTGGAADRPRRVTGSEAIAAPVDEGGF